MSCTDPNGILDALKSDRMEILTELHYEWNWERECVDYRLYIRQMLILFLVKFVLIT